MCKFPPKKFPSGRPIPTDLQQRMARELEKAKKARVGKL